MIPALLQPSGLLPVGRHPATLVEFENVYVTAPAFRASTTRTDIWQHFQDALALLKMRTPVIAVWLAGSFTTDKMDPDDIDVVFLIDAADVARVPGDHILGTFSSNLVRPSLGFRLDTFVIEWRSIPDPNIASQADMQYYLDRGHWDDFWQRKRSGPKTAVPVRADTLPARGYLEVMIDGYRP